MNSHKDINRFLYTPKSRQTENGTQNAHRARRNGRHLDANEQTKPYLTFEADAKTDENKALGLLPIDGIPLGRGMMLKIQSIPYAFTLPHRYHERLEYDVTTHYPEARILLNRRVGYLGAAAPVRYSLLAYLESERDIEVKIAGAALNSIEAWTFNTLIPLHNLGIGIAKTLEHIAALPIHNAVDLNNGGNRCATNKEIFAHNPFCSKG